jgi:hypothetical protein
MHKIALVLITIFFFVNISNNITDILINYDLLHIILIDKLFSFMLDFLT